MEGATFSLCNFKDTRIINSNLEKADFRYADVKRLNISKCKLSKADFRRAYGLSSEMASFLKDEGVEVTVSDKLRKYISYAVLLLFIIILFSFRLFTSNHTSTEMDSPSSQVPVPNQMSYEEFRSYVDKNAFTDNLIINGDFTSGLDWWMSSDDYYKKGMGIVKVEERDYHSTPQCIRTVSGTVTRIHANHKERNFSQFTPYVSFIDIKGYKELALSFWYKLSAPNVYVVVNTRAGGAGNLIALIDLPCTPEQWNNYSAIVKIPSAVLGFEIEMAFSQGETLLDDVEVRVKK